MTTVCENILLNTCWIFSSLYTYTTECCCHMKKKNICSKAPTENSYICEGSEYNYSSNLISNDIEKTKELFNYNFIVIEIQINEKNYVIKNHENYMKLNESFLKKNFVIKYLKENNNMTNISENSSYVINLMDNNSNFITLDNNSYLLLKQEKYEVIKI